MTIPLIYRTVLAIAAPAVVELVLTSMTQLADTIMVGRIGAFAISAVGLTAQPRFIMLSAFVALNVGTTALVARFRGQRNRREAELVAVQSLLISLVVACLLTVPGVALARQMVVFMGAEADTVDAATAYFRIIMLGFVPTVLPITISALLRGVGDTRTAMRYNVTANLVNIVFNYLLIYGKFGFPRLGVAGAAIATVIGNCCGCAMAFYAVLRKRGEGDRAADFLRLRFTRENCVPNLAMLKRILRIGLPSSAEQIAMRAGLLIYTLTITALGTRIFAAHQIVLTILSMSFVNGQAFGIAATSLVGQALGRGEPETARACAGASQRLGALISTLMGIGLLIFRRSLVALFTAEGEVIALGASVIIVAAFIQPFSSSFQIYSGALRGAGDSLYPALSLTIGILGIRPLLSYLLVQVWPLGLFGAWIALAADQIVRCFFILLHYRKGKWVHIKV